MIALVVCAREVPEAAAVVRAQLALGHGSGRATVVATRERLHPGAAAAENACCAMAHDLKGILSRPLR